MKNQGRRTHISRIPVFRPKDSKYGSKKDPSEVIVDTSIPGDDNDDEDKNNNEYRRSLTP